MKVSKLLLSLAAVVALLVATVSPADAGFRMRIETGTTTGPGIVISDEGVGDGLTGTPDAILYAGSVGSFTLTVTTGTATPTLIAAGYYDAIDLNNITINSSGAGTIRLLLEHDGFNTAPDGAVTLESAVGGVLAGPAGSKATFTSWANASNLMPSLGPDTAAPFGLAAIPDLPPAGSTTAGPMVFGPGAFSGAVSAGFVKSGPYSLFSSAVITFTGAGSISFDHQTGTQPAPAGLVLLAAGAPFLAFGYYRRKKAAVTA